MANQFQHHYTLADARALLEPVKAWLAEIRRLKQRVEHQEQFIAEELADGADVGGRRVNDAVRSMIALQDVLGNFVSRDIQIKDLDRGLVDFPSMRGNREVFLCWEEGEDDIEFWHDLDSGFAGRERI